MNSSLVQSGGLASEKAGRAERFSFRMLALLPKEIPTFNNQPSGKHQESMCKGGGKTFLRPYPLPQERVNHSAVLGDSHHLGIVGRVGEPIGSVWSRSGAGALLGIG